MSRRWCWRSCPFWAVVGLVAVTSTVCADTSLQEVDRALRAWQAHSTSPSYGAAYCHALARAGQWTKALSTISSMVDDPTLSLAWQATLRQDAGFCFLALNRWSDAATEFQRSQVLLAQDPNASASLMREARVRLDGIREWSRWVTAGSKHFVFHFEPGGTCDTAEERASFAYLADLSFETICRTLKGQLAAKIHYFAAKDRSTVQRLFGTGVGGFAQSPLYQIHCGGQEGPSQHEITHVVTAHVCPEQMGLAAFVEGIACYFDWSGRDVHELAAPTMESQSLSRILASPDSMSLRSLGSGYQLSASFLGHLLETYPWSAVSVFCSGCKLSPEAASLRAFRKPLATLSAEWQARARRSEQLGNEEQRALKLSAAEAEPILVRSRQTDRFRVAARLYLGQLWSDQGKCKEAREVLTEAWQVVTVRGWSPELIGQLTAELAYVESRLDKVKYAKEHARCTLQIRQPEELVIWATNMLEDLRNQRPAQPPPRVHGRDWREKQ